ncbi:gliding motility-associated C-terminal domain-containing protein [Chitinophaga rhizophila]|uniref:Gliding motility-associated C-terminal domain-containing protein n=1 Tax=Chitinophaga rhizophila TaxID=2866212 RepID=A0ABS7GE16_9BACT|nr:gliding motility-associated C-terminal domain-containing protein [Chitinophaga rhizophila]MBW8685913.1 gliding motility-associated C-terminal domain-containing protein [Chitinophaga rhizophila]
MYLKATPKGPLRAFILIFFCLVWLVGLPVGKASFRKLPVTKSIVTNTSTAWLDNYLYYHPYAPLRPNAWRAVSAAADGPLWSYAASQSFVTFGVACALCRVDNGANAIDANPNTAATLVLPAGALGGVGLKLKFSGTYQAGDQVALDLEIPDQIYSQQLLAALSVSSFNGGISNNDATPLNSSQIRLDLLGLGLGSTPKFRVTATIARAFDEVQISFSALVTTFSTLRVYEAAAFIPVTISPATPAIPIGGTVTFSPSIRIPGATYQWYTTPEGGTPVFSGAGFTTPALKRTTTYYVSATNPLDGLVSPVRTPVTVRVNGGTGPIWSYADQQVSPVTGGIACALCYVDNPAAAVDADTTTASMLQLPVGAITSVGQLLRFPGDYKAGDRIVLDLEIPGQLLSAGALSAIQFQTFNNNVANNDAVNLGIGTIRVDALGLGLGSTPKFRVTIPVTKDFDAAQVSLTTAFTAFGSLRIYEAAAVIPVNITPAAPLITAGSSVTLAATTDARVSAPVYRWYTSPTDGTPVATGNSFPTPLLNRTTTYYVEAFSAADNLSSYVRTPVTVKVAGGPGTIWSYGQEQESPFTTGVACAACTVGTPAAAADGDTATASTLTVPLGIAASVGQLVKLPGVYQAGDSIVLFLEAPTENLAAVVLPRVNVTTFNNSIAGPAVSNNDQIRLDAATVKLQVLGIGLNNARKFRVTIPATKTFDGVRVDFGGLVGVSGALKLYEVAAMIPVAVLPSPARTPYNTGVTLTPSIRTNNPVFTWYTAPTGGSPVFTGSGAFTTPALIRNTTYYVEAKDPAGTNSLVRTAVPVTIGGGTGPLWTYGTSQNGPITGGIACALCTITDPAFAADGDSTTASRLVLPLGVASTLGQKINFPGNYRSGDSIILILGSKADFLADASVLGSIRVTTSLNNVSNNDPQTLNNPLLRVNLLQTQAEINKFRVAIPVSRNFDAAQVDISSLLALDNTLYIYEAIAMTPVVVTPAPATITVGQTATLNATLPSVPGVIFNWYETLEGGSPVHTGNSLTTPPLFQDKTYYVEAVSPTDGLISIRRTAVEVDVNGATGNGPLSCSGAKTQNSGTGGLACLLCGTTDPTFATDDDPLTASTIRLGVGALGYAYQDLVFAAKGKAGDSIRLGLGTTTGLLDLGLISGIGIGLGNGARPADAEMAGINSSLLTLRLLNGVQQTAYTFVANKEFDRIEIRLNAVVGALSSLNVYYAQVVTPVVQPAVATAYVCTGSPATLSAIAPAGYTYRWYTSYTGGTPVGYGATFISPAITKDTTYFVEAAGADSCGSERRTPVQVKTGLPGVTVTPSSASVEEGTTPTFNVVSPNAGYQYNWYSGPTGGTPVFVGTQFTAPPVTGNVTYYAEAVLQGNTGCRSLRTPVSVTLNGDGGPADPGDIDCGGATSQQTATSGICVGCYVEKPDSAVDNSSRTASVIHTILGVGANIQQSLIFPAPGVRGDSVRIKLGFTTGLADLSVLSGIQISSSNAGTLNNDEVTLTPGILNLQLLNGNRDLIYSFAPGAAFDRVNIKLNGLATALTALKVYSAQIFAGTPTVERDTVYICQGATGTLRATGPGATFRWYNQPAGGTVLGTGATFQVSDVTNAIYYVESVSSSGCVNPARKPVYVIVGLPQPVVTPAVRTINAGQTVTFAVASPNPAYQYNWYDAPAGGNVVQSNAPTFTTPALSAAAVYYVEVRDPANNCTSPVRTRVQVDINLPTEPTPCSYAKQQVSPVISGVCLLCAVSDPGLAVDENSNSASTITATVNALGYVGQLLRFENTYPAGDSVTLDLEIPGQLADAALLGGIRLETYNGSTPNADAVFLNNTLVHLTLLNTGNKFRVTIPVSKAFNGVMVSINGVLAALTSVKVYFAAVVTPRPQATVANVDVCSGNTATLNASTANGADLAWYTVAVGGTPVQIGASYTTGPLTASATYYVEAGRFGCANPTRIPVRVNVGATPAVPVAAGRAICTGSPATLLATAPAGATFRWYTAPTGGTLLASTASYTTNALTADTAFYVESDNNGCRSTTRTRVPVTVSPAPGTLTVTPLTTTVSSGQGAIFTAYASGTNITYKWYNAAGDSIFTGAVFNTGPLTATTSFSAEAVTAGGCKNGPRVIVTATVVPGNNDIPCDAANSQQNTANGICVGCYVENPALAVDNSTSTRSTLRVALGLLNGYVQQSLVFPQISELNDSTVIALSFDGSLADVGLLSTIEIGSFNGAASNNDFVALNNPLVKVSLLSGNQQALVGFKPKALFDRIVVRLNSGVATALSAVNIHFASRVVGLPVVKGDTICAGNRASLTAAGPANVSFRWYTTATGGSSIFTGTSYQTPALTANTTYYVEAVKTSLNCPNLQRVPVTAIVDPVPDVPVLDTTALTICSGSTATFNVTPVAGITYRWYTSLTGGTAFFTGTSYTSPALNATTVYYIEAANATGCANTTRTRVTANVITQPVVPVVTPTSATICANNSTQLVATSTTPGVTFRWYAAATGGTPVFEGASFQTPVLTATTTYYVEAVTGTCASAGRTAATVTVNTVPAAPTVTTVPANGQVISGQTATLTANSVTPGVNYAWYTVATGGSSVATGVTFITPALTSNITYYVEAVAGAGSCPSQRTAVPLTVTVAPNTVCDFANAQTNSTTAVCVLCSVQDAANTTDADINNFSILSVPLAAGSGSVQQSLIFPDAAAAGDSVRIVMELPAQVVDASLLSSLEISSFNGATANSDAVLLNSNTVSVRLLTGTSKFTVAFAPGAIYDRVQIRLRGGIVSALVRANVYYATRQVSAPSVAVRNLTICSGNTATLSATGSAVSTLEWYSAPVGGQKLGEGTSFTTPQLTATTTYYVQSKRTANNCANPNRVSVTVSVVPALVAPAVTNATICAGQQATLTANVTGQNIQTRWYNAPTGGTLLFTGTTYVTNALNADTAFYIETGNGSCTLASRVRATVSVGAGAPVPVLETPNVDICAGGTASFRVTTPAAGVTYRWFTALTGGTQVATGPTFTTPAISTTTVYYVEAINDASQCGSAGTRVAATASVALNPGAPAVQSASISVCAGQDATLAVLNPQAGLTYQWYDAATGGTLVQSGPTFVIRAANASADYYVQAVNSNGCISTGVRTRASVVVTPAPGTPAVVSNVVNVCRGNTAVLAVQTSGNFTYRWYTTPTGGTAVGTGPSFTTPELTVNTDFYVEATGGNCSSAVRARVSVLVSDPAPTPTLEAANVNVCTGAAAVLRVTSQNTGITYNWYTAATGGTPVFTGSEYTTPQLTATAVYYVEAVNAASGCGGSGTRVAATVTVVPRPGAPVLVSNSVEVCAGQNTVLFIQNPQDDISYQWYDAPTGGTLVFTGPAFVVNGVTSNVTYYVQAVNSNGCANAGARVGVTVNVTTAPAVPVTAANVTACPGTTVNLSVQNPNPALTYNWYTTATGGTLAGTGSTFTTPVVNAATTYYVEATNDNCTSATRAAVSITLSTAAPVPTLESNNVTTCTGGTARLRVISTTTGVIYNWYTTATGGTSVFTGPEFVTPNLNASTTYYVEAVSNNSQCAGTSTRVAATVTVGQSPDVPVLAAGSVRICAGEDATFTVQNPQSGIDYQWFDAANGGMLVFTGPSFTATAVTANTTYYVQAATGTTCVSTSRATANIVVDAAAPTPDVTATNVVTCTGGTATFNVLNPDAALTYRWYDAPANGTLLATGPEYTTAALNSNTTYYVEALNGSGCISQARKGVTVTVVNTISAPLANGATICAGTSALLAITNPQAGITYRWYSTATGGTAGFTGAEFTTPQLNTNMTYYVEASSGGCVSQSRTIVQVTVNTTPASPVVANATVTACQGETASLSILNPNPAFTYRWYTSPTGGTPAGTGNSFTTPAITANTTYYVEALNASGCASATRTTVNVNVGASANNATVTGNESGICPGETATLTATSTTTGAGFRWYTTETGGTPVANTAAFTTPALNDNTTYYVEVVSAGGCTSTSRVAVEVNILQALAAPVVTVGETQPTQVTFQWAAVPGASSYEVTLDNGTTYILPSSGAGGLTHSIYSLTPGQAVTIRVRALGDADCETSALSAAVTATAENPQGNRIFVPNVFTPNGDGFNDVHYVFGTTIANVVIRYYNQFGQQIFESKDQRAGWDGTMSGRQQPVGVYIWVLRATLQDGSVVNMKGTVTIVR